MVARKIPVWIHISYHFGLEEMFTEYTSLLIQTASKSELYGDQRIPDFRELPEKLQGESPSTSESVPF
jgi:hypothetical protein